MKSLTAVVLLTQISVCLGQFTAGSCSSKNVNLGSIQVSYVVGNDAGQDQVQFTLTLNSGSTPQYAALGFADNASPANMNGLNIVACSTSVNPQGFAQVAGVGAPTTQDNTETTPGTSTETGGSLTCTFQRNIYDMDPMSSTKSLVFGTAFGIAFAVGTGEVGSTWANHGGANRGRQSLTIDKCDTPAPPTPAPPTAAPPTPAPAVPASGFVASCPSNNVNLGSIQVSYVVGNDAGQDQVQFTLTLNSGSTPQYAALGFADDATPANMNGLNIVACSTSVNPQGFAQVAGVGAPTTQDNTETTPGTSTETGGSLTCTFQRNIYDMDPMSSTKSLVFGTAFGIAFAVGTGEVGSTWANHGGANRGRQSLTIDKCDTPAPPTPAPPTPTPPTPAPPTAAPPTPAPAVPASGFVASCPSNNVNLGSIQVSYVVGNDAGQDQVQFTLTLNSGSTPQYAALGFADDATPANMNGLNIVACSTSVNPQGFAQVAGVGAPTTQDNTETTPGASTETGGSLTCTFQRNIYDMDPMSSTKSLVFGTAFGIAFAVGTGEVGSTWANHGGANRGRQSLTIDKCDTPAPPTPAPPTPTPPTPAPPTAAPPTPAPAVPASGFVASCPSNNVNLGSIQVSYVVGNDAGQDQVQFTLTLNSGSTPQYAALGFADDASPANMNGLNIVACSTSVNPQGFAQVAGVGAPTTQDNTETTPGTSTETGGSLTCTFQRNIYDMDPMSSTKSLVFGTAFGIAFAVGTGEVGSTWANHGGANRGRQSLTIDKCDTPAPPTPAPPTPTPPTPAPPTAAPPTPAPAVPASGFVASCPSNNVNLGSIQVSYVVGNDAGQDQVQFTLTLNSGSTPQYAALGFADDATPANMNGLNIVACSTSVNPQGFAQVAGVGAPTTQDNTETTPGTSTETGGSLTCTFQRNIYDMDPMSSTKSLVFGTAFGIAFAVGTGEVGSTWANHGGANRGRQSLTIDKCDTPAPPTPAPATNAPPTTAPSTAAPATTAPLTAAPPTPAPAVPPSGFVASCPSNNMNLGSIQVSYVVGNDAGQDQVQFTLTLNSGSTPQYAALGFADDASPANMNGLNIVACSTSVNPQGFAQVAGVGAPTTQDNTETTPGTSTETGGSLTCTFQRNIYDMDPMSSTKSLVFGTAFGIAFAVGTGEVGSTWANHGGANRGRQSLTIDKCDTPAPPTPAPATNAPPTTAPSTAAPATTAPLTAAPPTPAPAVPPSGFVASCPSNNMNLGSIQVSYVVGKDAGQDQVQFTLTLNSGSTPQYAALGFADDASPANMNGLNIVACSTSVNPQGFAQVAGVGAPTTQDNTETTPGTSTETGGSLTCTFQRNIYDMDPMSSTKSLVFGTAFGIAFAVGTGEVGSTWANHGGANRGRQSLTIDKCDTPAPPTPAPATNAPPTTAPSTAAPATTAPRTTAPDTMAPVPLTDAPPTVAPLTQAPPTLVPGTYSPTTTQAPAGSTLAPITNVPGVTLPPQTDAPATQSPPTLVPGTYSPTTTQAPAGSTLAPITNVPGVTLPPQTDAPATQAPPTLVPGTYSPTTTQAPAGSTLAPITNVPGVTLPPQTDAPATQAPPTLVPGTYSPDTTQAPAGSTLAPVTNVPGVTLPPQTDAPATQAPPTLVPGTYSPTTTQAPAGSTLAPITNVPGVTLPPQTDAPATQAPPTLIPGTYSPDTTQAPAGSTLAPITNVPGVTLPPQTDAPATQAPPTLVPGTYSPDTTQAPPGSTLAPITNVPGVTLPPQTDAPATQAPPTLVPGTYSPDTTQAPAGSTLAPITNVPGVTLPPQTDAPATLSPLTLSPPTYAPGSTEAPPGASRVPLTDSPGRTLAPQTNAPTNAPAGSGGGTTGFYPCAVDNVESPAQDVAFAATGIQITYQLGLVGVDQATAERDLKDAVLFTVTMDADLTDWTAMGIREASSTGTGMQGLQIYAATLGAQVKASTVMRATGTPQESPSQTQVTLKQTAKNNQIMFSFIRYVEDGDYNLLSRKQWTFAYAKGTGVPFTAGWTKHSTAGFSSTPVWLQRCDLSAAGAAGQTPQADDDSGFPIWIIFVIVGSVLLLCGCIAAAVMKMRTDKSKESFHIQQLDDYMTEMGPDNDFYSHNEDPDTNGEGSRYEMGLY